MTEPTGPAADVVSVLRPGQHGAAAAAIAAGHARGVPCHLETADPANVAFYRQFGFEVVDAALEVIPGGGPTLTTMRRPPR